MHYALSPFYCTIRIGSRTVESARVKSTQTRVLATHHVTSQMFESDDEAFDWGAAVGDSDVAVALALAARATGDTTSAAAACAQPPAVGGSAFVSARAVALAAQQGSSGSGAATGGSLGGASATTPRDYKSCAPVAAGGGGAARAGGAGGAPPEPRVPVFAHSAATAAQTPVRGPGSATPAAVNISRMPAAPSVPSDRAMPRYVLGLNDEQRAAALMGLDTPLLIIACAGSGKTTTMCSRLAHILEVSGCHPAEVVAITFTRNAANGIREKLQRALAVRKRRARPRARAWWWRASFIRLTAARACARRARRCRRRARGS